MQDTFAWTQTMTEDWNELRLVLAIARAGGLIAAARALAIDHSTAFRRLQAIERALGHQLFERGPGGAYLATPIGQRMAAAAEQMEAELLTLARDIAGRDRRLTGHLRLTSSDTLAHRLLTPHLAAFHCAHPGIVVELLIDNRILNLSRREADVALRPVRPREGDLWGRKLADVAWTVYGARRYLKKKGSLSTAKDLGSHFLIGSEESGASILATDWFASLAAPSQFVYRTSSLVGQFNAAKAGIGLAVLPCYLGDGEPGLGRALHKPIAELMQELWIITHADLKRTARVRAFFDIVGDRLAAQRPLFEGRAPERPSTTRSRRT
jgi:DNA-binding transcriptional LysR family regulator